MTARELELRREIFAAFAATGAPPPVRDEPALRALAERHVVVLDEGPRIRMAHPFAAHDRGAEIRSGDRVWRGNCAWDALGIVAALGLPRATVHSDGLTLDVREGEPLPPWRFHVLVPAARWWDDVGFT